MSNVTKQKLMLSFISLTLIVAFVGFLMMNESLAWFSNNKTVSANGLSVSAQGTANLVIGKTEAEIRSGNMQFAVSFNGTSRTDMIAVTRDTSYGAPYLKYLTNHYAVDNKTGLANGSEALAFAAVPTTDNEQYFIDYTVYIASTKNALQVSALTVIISSPASSSLSDDYKYLNAASIDFYLGASVTAEGYLGTLSVANPVKHNATNIDLFKGQGGTVPLNTTGSIAVTMRCYFDGALVDASGNAYINSYNVKTTGINLGVHFVATEVAEGQQ